jgi:hypothetical protein
VKAGGVDVGGQTSTRAATNLALALRAAAHAPVDVRLGRRSFRLQPATPS